MRTTKTRTALVALAAAASVMATTGAIAPAANAKKNTGGYSRSAEAHRKVDNWCADTKTTFQNYSTMIEQDLLDGRTADAQKDMDAQKQVLDFAKSLGCGWSARVITRHRGPAHPAPTASRTS
ncbi:MAG: hypothetical protein E6G56_03930 [Actinobacteria bacterium]|nr:MAG: hypothetical protein E6G56_03930 [Actinomycetota bacterium]